MSALFLYEKLEDIKKFDLSKEIKMVANLGEVYVNAKDILNICEDDVLILDTKLSDKLEVVCNNENKLYGIMCISNDKRAILLR